MYSFGIKSNPIDNEKMCNIYIVANRRTEMINPMINGKYFFSIPIVRVKNKKDYGNL
jgi:hypothetical protein